VGRDELAAMSETLGDKLILVQIGTAQYILPNGKWTFEAFYELKGFVPFTPIKGISIFAGDKVYATIKCTNVSGGPCPAPGTSAQQYWTLTIQVQDPTNPRKVQSAKIGPKAYNSSQASVDWIIEAPLCLLKQCYNNTLQRYMNYATPNFGLVTIDPSVGANGVNPPPLNTAPLWPYWYYISLKNPNGGCAHSYNFASGAQVPAQWESC
jgi:hypothetical protein